MQNSPRRLRMEEKKSISFEMRCGYDRNNKIRRRIAYFEVEQA